MTSRSDPDVPPHDHAPLAAATARANLNQLVHLRWIAVAGQIVTIAFAALEFHIRLPIPLLACVLATFIAGNLLSQLRMRSAAQVTNQELLLALTFDAGILTALLYLSGGASNPFVSLYLLQVILAALLLEAWAVWAIVGVIIVCFVGLTRLYRPLVYPADGFDPFTLYIAGTVIDFVLNAVLLVIFIGRISRNLQQRDLRIADLRQRAAEEDHIVRMGLLASGAAHELGTPLATLDVILADWRRMLRLVSDPEIAQEIEDMQSEVARCKAIVTGVLLSAGAARAEAAGVSNLKPYLADLFAEWKTRRAATTATYEDELIRDPAVVADSALKQALCNLLDNAFEASPTSVRMRSRVIIDELALTVQDSGPGIPLEILAEFGRPYQSTKGRAGGGLGLFLVANVVRKLGGRVAASNPSGGGAEVTVFLPIATFALEAAE
jgi:two-component system sensor histidine kinase RegB